MRCPGRAAARTCSLKPGQQSHSSWTPGNLQPSKTHFLLLLNNHCTEAGGFTVMHCICKLLPWIPPPPPPLILGLCRGEAGRGALLLREDAVLRLWPQRCSARDTFSVITCRHVSAERRWFSHCFLSVLIWWMLPGTQHVSLETSWKSGGHWRHLKGLSEACLRCPGNVFHWGRSLFSFRLSTFIFLGFSL